MASRAPLDLDQFRYRHPVEVRFADTDALGHVNNAVYLTYFEAARAGLYEALTGTPFGTGPRAPAHSFVVAEARVVFRAPALFGERLAVGVRIGWASRSSFEMQYRIDASTSMVAEARLVAFGESVQVMFDPATSRPMRLPGDLLELFERHEGGPLPAPHP
jgi:acyl-CoA thioester hydrolase